MNKKIALISSYCNDQEKIDVLYHNILKLKEHDLDVFLISPLTLPEKIIKACDYFFYTKDNQVLSWPLNVQMYYRYWDLPDKNYLILKKPSLDYGWAGLNQIKKSTEIALTFNYDYYYYLIYDLDIDKIIEDILNNPKNSCVFGSQRGGFVWECSLNFMIFNKENAEKFSNLITLNNYLNFLNSSALVEGKDAFGFLNSLKNILNFEISKHKVKDKIFINQNFFNHSPIEEIKFFIEKNTVDLEKELKIIFFDVASDVVSLDININNINKSIDLKMLEVVSLGINSLDFECGFIKYNEKKIDLNPIIKSIDYSSIEISNFLPSINFNE